MKERRYTIVAKSLCLLVSLFLITVRSQGTEIELAGSGSSAYSIVLPNEPSPIQQTAANELQEFFKQVTDVELPIIQESDVLNQDSIELAKLFIIGPGNLSQKALGNDVNELQIGYDGVILKSVGNSIVLSGSPQRGPLYSVYEFLEKKLGCRWWTSTESTIPHIQELTISNDLDIIYTPKLEYRESFYRDCFNGSFAVKMKCNGNSENIPDEFGSHHIFQYFVHSSYNLIPPQKYYLKHPEWFPEIDGVRKVGIPAWVGQSQEYKEFEKALAPEQIYSAGTQLCFSNDELLAEIVKNAREVLRNNPKASFLSISQNDWHGYCTCEKCRAIDEEEGSHAGSLLRGVNKIAEALEDEFPHLYIETLAYQYTRKPPKITKPRNNVVVRLCSIECSFAQPLEAEVNKSFHDDLVGWSKIANKLFVWDYATDFAFYLLPFPNYRVLAPNINFYVNHNVVGFFEQGDYQCETGDFVQLRNWVVAKLLWAPSLDPKELVKEFIAGYYAPELVPLYCQYFDVLSDAVKKANYYLGIFKTNTNGWLDTDSLTKATLIQKEVLAVAKHLEAQDPTRYQGLVSKVRREQIPLDVVWMQEYRNVREECRIRGLNFVGPSDPAQAARELVAKFDEFGLTKSKEVETSEAFNQYKQELLTSFDDYTSNETATPSPCQDIPTTAWLEIQNFDLNKHKLGEWTFNVSDPNASNGKAVKMPGAHNEWATSWNVTRYIDCLLPANAEQNSDQSPVYHIYAYVRCDADAVDGAAMTLGVYDEESKRGLLHKQLSVSEIKGESYSLIDLGSTELPKTAYLWFAPPQRPDEVDAIYIDRAIVVREK